MTLSVRLSSHGQLQLWANQQLVASKLSMDLPTLKMRGASISHSPWEVASEGPKNSPSYWRRVVRIDGEPVLTAEVRSMGSLVTFAVLFEQALSQLEVGDTFEAFSVALPRITAANEHRCFLTTYGLGPSGNGGVGGYWPEAIVTHSTADLPTQAFSPLVLFNSKGALAIAPSSQFLTSTLLADQGDIVRTLHGSMDRIETGTRIETLFAWGEDVTNALLRAGDELLERSGKARLDPHASTVTSNIGWWNAYGSYYTEPIHPLDGAKLAHLVESLKDQGVPVEYLGLDLWYPYRTIGQALRFSPDPQKYPDGVSAISQSYKLPVVLHLSALADENEYRTDGSDPTFYHEVAEELQRQGAIVAWHDWLRTQQHLSSRLRSEPETADRWFRGMAEAMAEKKISVMTCMQTMGMVLASTALPNIFAARSSIDYLFAQPQALDTLERLNLGGFRDEATPLHVMRRQNLLVGLTYYAMGLLPFYDLFLTRWHDDVGGLSPWSEAVLRSLSCGPVGIGDAPGMTDLDLLRSLLSEQGHVLRPDHPPYPDTRTLGQPVELYRTEHKAGMARWEYVVALNTTSEEQPFEIPLSPSFVAWDARASSVVDRAQGILPPGELAYYVLAPKHDGIAPLGLRGKVVPAPSHVILDAEWANGWKIHLDAPSETFAVWSSAPICIYDEREKELETVRQGSFTFCSLGGNVSMLEIKRR